MQARALSGPHFDEQTAAHVEIALECVRRAAEKGERSVKLYGDLWGQGMGDPSHQLHQAARHAWDRLSELGYVLASHRDGINRYRTHTIVEW